MGRQWIRSRSGDDIIVDTGMEKRQELDNSGIISEDFDYKNIFELVKKLSGFTESV